MTDKGHWPFDADDGAHGSQGPDRSRARKDQSRNGQGGYRPPQRFNRLIVGGRAHTKKRGLS